MNYCEIETCTEDAMHKSKYCEVHSGHIPINFNEAHNAWIRNKVRLGNGYKYVCGAQKTDGKYCKKRIYIRTDQPNKSSGVRCRWHQLVKE
jgi:hypothetical protein